MLRMLRMLRMLMRMLLVVLDAEGGRACVRVCLTWEGGGVRSINCQLPIAFNFLFLALPRARQSESPQPQPALLHSA